MQVLWGACAQPGSLFPAIPIVLELMRRGHQVTATASDAGAADMFRGLGCDFVPQVRASAVPPLSPPVTRAAKFSWFSASASAVCIDVAEVLRQRSFDVVLADPLEIGVDFAAELAGIPACSYVHWGLDEVGPDIPFRFHLWDGDEPIADAFVHWWNGLRAAVGLPAEERPAAEHRWYRTSRRRTLLLGLPELVYPKAQLPPGVVRVGPSLWDPPLEVPAPPWLRTIGAERPAILASVSTVGNMRDTRVLGAIADAAQSLDFELVLTVPVQHDPLELPGHVRVTSFLPHNLLLPRVSLFVNHAGNGAVNRAACAGIPVLMLPTGRDQFQVAQGATAAGLGLSLPPEAADAPAVLAGLTELSNDGRYTRVAQELAVAATRYDAPSASADEIEALTH